MFSDSPSDLSEGNGYFTHMSDLKECADHIPKPPQL